MYLTYIVFIRHKFVQLLLALTMKFWRIFANKFSVVDKIHNSGGRM
jgi:hypothetical protein